jgi:NDP-sugar pyrophosphorylase family protein
MTENQNNDFSAVILCGGQGTRMGSLTEELPKSLLDVQGRPILWYIVLRLYLSGVRRFILPVGYLGHRIAQYVETTFGDLDCEIVCVDTGADTPIGQRIHRVRNYLPEEGNLFLTNGDALFDFDAAEIAALHRDADAAITFATVQTISKYGLVVLDGERVTGFERESRISGYQIDGETGLNTGLVYAGICMLRTRSLDMIDLGASRQFESELFPTLISKAKTAQFELPGFWYSIDTPKDLAGVNIGGGANPLFASPATRLKNDIEASLSR